MHYAAPCQHACALLIARADNVTFAGPQLTIADEGAAARRIVIKPGGFMDAVVWNPWTEKSKALGDFGDDEFRNMVCVEPANAAMWLSGSSVDIAPGTTWAAQQSVYVEPPAA